MNILGFVLSVKIFQLTILVVGIFLVLSVFYTGHIISRQSESLMMTLEHLLPSKNTDK